MKVEFKDNTIQVSEALSKIEKQFLNDASRVLLNQTIRNSRVDTGQTKSEWDRVVDTSEHKGIVGNTSENAIWEEFGTGHYAVDENGNPSGKGRQNAWYVPTWNYTGHKKPTYQGKVVVVYGKEGKSYYKTDGKKPNRALGNALVTTEPIIRKRLEDLIKGTMNK